MIDLQALAATTRPVEVTPPDTVGGYDEFEQFRDFQDVLVAGRGPASDDQKRRVLFQILALCGVLESIVTNKHDDMLIRAGKHEVGIDIVNLTIHEPRPQEKLNERATGRPHPDPRRG